MFQPHSALTRIVIAAVASTGELISVDEELMTIYDPETDDVSWLNIDDPVMGGRSRSQTRVVNRGSGKCALRFAGEVSLENNGGFCSTRTDGKAWDTSGATGFAIELVGDGRRYKFTVRTDEDERGSYRVSFDTRDGVRERHTFAFDDFEMYDRGRHLPNAAALDVSRIQALGFLISDKQAGPFRLDVFSIRAA